MNSLWDRLSEHNFVKGDIPSKQQTIIPWYIRFLQGFAGWVAAFFLIASFSAAFNFLFHSPNSNLLISLGVFCTVIAYVLIRTQEKDFFDQLGLAFGLCGQLLVAFGLFNLFKYEYKTILFILASYQLLLAWFIPQFAHRLLSSVFGLLALLVALNLQGLNGIGTTVAAALFSFIWLKQNRWGRAYNSWEPIGFGFAITLVLSSGYLLTDNFLLNYYSTSPLGWLSTHAQLVSSLLIALVFVNVVIVLLKENKIDFSSKTAFLSFFVAILLVILSFKVFGLSTGVLIVILGFARQRLTLVVLGSMAVVSFFSWYYYNLDATLLFKSITLIVLGSTLMASWFFLGKIYHKNNKEVTFVFSLPNAKKWIVISTILLVLVAINFNIVKKQNLIKNGEMLLFELAPADPRSLMQGDYMRLRFAIANKINTKLKSSYPQNSIPSQFGSVIVEKGVDNVVNFIALYEQQNLSPNQYKVPFKYRNYQVVFTTNAFYFQEGQATHYQKAKYGEFRVSKTAEMILVAMRDKDFNIL